MRRVADLHRLARRADRRRGRVRSATAGARRWRWSGRRTPTHGDYATTLALRLAQAAQAVAARHRRRSSARASRATTSRPSTSPARGSSTCGCRRPGTDAALARSCRGRPLRRGAAARPQKLLVEFVSANPTGDLTVGSGRNAAYGDSVARVLAFAGHEVTREYYFNDARPAGRAVRRVAARATARAGAAGGRLPGRARSPRWPRSSRCPTTRRRGLGPSRHGAHDRAASARSLERIRVDMDIWFSETELHGSGAVERAIERARAAGYVEERDGATWLRTTAFGDDKDRVVVRSDDGDPDVPGRRPRVRRPQVVARPRAPAVRARRRPPRLHRAAAGGRRRASGTTPSWSRCCCTR